MIPAYKDDTYIYCKHGTPISPVNEPNMMFPVICQSCVAEAEAHFKESLDALPSQEEFEANQQESLPSLLY